MDTEDFHRNWRRHPGFWVGEAARGPPGGGAYENTESICSMQAPWTVPARVSGCV